MPQANPLKQIVVKQKEGKPVGIYSCCSANDYVIEAALECVKRDDSCVLIEATANQVDQNGAWSAAAAVAYMDTILAEYSEANGNMVELVIANNDDMGLGAITALQTAGYNQGVDENGEPLSTNIPVFTVDGLQGIVDAINAGTATGAVGQSASGLASAVVTLVQNYQADGDLMSNTEGMNVDETVAKIRVPYTTVS